MHTSYKNLASTPSSREQTCKGVDSKYRRDGFGIAVCTVEPRIGVLPAVWRGMELAKHASQAGARFAMTLGSRWSPFCRITQSLHLGLPEYSSINQEPERPAAMAFS